MLDRLSHLCNVSNSRSKKAQRHFSDLMAPTGTVESDNGKSNKDNMRHQRERPLGVKENGLSCSRRGHDWANQGGMPGTRSAHSHHLCAKSRLPFSAAATPKAKDQGHLDLSFHFKPSLTSNSLNQLYRHHPSASIDYRTVTPHGRRISQPTLYCSTNKQAAVASPQSCPSSGIPSVAPRTLRAPSSRNPSLVAMSLPRAQLTSRSRLNTS